VLPRSGVSLSVPDDCIDDKKKYRELRGREGEGEEMTSEQKEESEVSFGCPSFVLDPQDLPSGLRARRVRYQAAPATAPPATAQMLERKRREERKRKVSA